MKPRGRAGSPWTAMTSIAALVLLAGIAPLRAVAVPLPQVADQSHVAFEFASVKPNRSGEMAIRWTFQDGRFTAVNVSLKALISSAYGSPQQPLPDFQISGGPSWLDSARFDIQAQVPAEAVDDKTAMTASTLGMLRRLLEERFQLRTHFESRDQPMYALVVSGRNGELGPQLRPRAADCASVAAGTASGEPCGGQIVPGRISARGVSMTQLVSGLARLMPNVGRLVVDRTGLTGTYDVDLTWTPDQLPPGDRGMPMPTPIPPIDPNGPSLFTALQEQLGVRLVSARGPVPVLVIDNAVLPTAD